MKILIYLLLAFGLLFVPMHAQKANYYNDGEKALGAKNFKKAIENFSKAIEKKQNLVKSYYNRGLSQLYLNNFDKAIDDFNEVIKRDGKLADAYNNRGLSYSYLGNTIKELEDLDKAIELDPKFHQAYINRAGVFILRTDFTNAQKDLDMAEKINPDNPELHFQKGRVYYNLDKFDKSILEYSKAMLLGLSNPKIYYNRANAYYKNNNIDSAIQDYSKTIEMNPNDMEALNNRAYCYKGIGLDSLAKLDRDKIAVLKGGAFTPIDSLIFTTFTNKTADFSIDLPNTWKLHEIPDENGMVQFIISPEDFDVEGSAMLVGVTVGIVKNMSSTYPVKNESDILDFWKGSLDESNKDFLKYEVIWQKHSQWNNHATILNQSYLQVGENFMPFLMYEYAIAYGNNLIFGYFQSPEFSFDYYSKVFDIALKSIKLGPNFKMD